MLDAVHARLEQLHSIKVEPTAPDDLQSFWKTVTSEAREAQVWTRTPVEQPWPHARCYDFTYRGAFGSDIHAWLLVPDAAGANELPCVVTLHGYSGSRGLPEDHAAWLLMGYAVLAIDLRGQGGTTGMQVPARHGMVKGWITHDILDPYSCYYRLIAQDALHAIYCAMEQPEIDPERVHLFGGSQGGGLALLVAALEPAVRSVVAHVPNMCQLDVALMQSVGSVSEAAEFVTRFPAHLPAVLKTLSYFDIVNVAEWIEAPVHVTVGLKDTTCVPDTIFAAYNRMRSSRRPSIEVYPFMGHALPPGFHAEAHRQMSQED